MTLPSFADNRKCDSFASKCRQRRLDFFFQLVQTLPKPIKILDVGGTMDYWQSAQNYDLSNIRIVLLNKINFDSKRHNISSIVGDARNMSVINNLEYDISFSNSVIEHVGDESDQFQMAREMRRVSKRYYLQTPNRYFVLEPHTVFPLFQFFPLWLKVFLLNNYKLGWYGKCMSKSEAREKAKETRLLTAREIAKMFPRSILRKEKVFGLTKSFVILGGWGDELKKLFPEMSKYSFN
jgi:hypothetical protein